MPGDRREWPLLLLLAAAPLVAYFPAWHEGDRVRVWVDGPSDVMPRA